MDEATARRVRHGSEGRAERRPEELDDTYPFGGLVVPHALVGQPHSIRGLTLHRFISSWTRQDGGWGLAGRKMVMEIKDKGEIKRGV